MNWLQVLYSSEIRIRQLSAVQKVQLYLLPLLLSGLIFYHSDSLNSFQTETVSKKVPLSHINSYEFMKAMEKQLKINALQLNKIEEQTNGLILEVSGAFNALLTFIAFCESYGSVNGLQRMEFLTSEEKPMVLKLHLQFSKVLYKHAGLKTLKKKIASLHSPFNKSNAVEHEGKEPLKLYAIVNNEALINHQWLSINQHIKEFKVVKVKQQQVILKDKEGHIIELEL